MNAMPGQACKAFRREHGVQHGVIQGTQGFTQQPQFGLTAQPVQHRVSLFVAGITVKQAREFSH